MIYIVDNGGWFSSHTIYFVQADEEPTDAELQLLFRGEGARVIGCAASLEWRHRPEEATTLREILMESTCDAVAAIEDDMFRVEDIPDWALPIILDRGDWIAQDDTWDALKEEARRRGLVE